MKKLASSVFVFIFVLGLAAFAIAQETTLKGQVVSIDPEGKTIVINTAEGSKTVIFQETTTGLGIKEIKPGMSVQMTCIDQEGKACAKDIKVISATEAGMPTHIVEGEVVSIDPDGRTVVIKSPKGEQVTIKIMQPGVEKMGVKEAAPAGEMITIEPMPLTEIKPGAKVRADCFDSEGMFCANKVTVVSPSAAGTPVETFEVAGEVTSIDPDGKTVVVKTEGGEKTLYYQKVTAGPALDALTVGKRVKAYCLDVSGKTCIKDISIEQ